MIGNDTEFKYRSLKLHKMNMGCAKSDAVFIIPLGLPFQIYTRDLSEHRLVAQLHCSSHNHSVHIEYTATPKEMYIEINKMHAGNRQFTGAALIKNMIEKLDMQQQIKNASTGTQDCKCISWHGARGLEVYLLRHWGKNLRDGIYICIWRSYIHLYTTIWCISNNHRDKTNTTASFWHNSHY